MHGQNHIKSVYEPTRQDVCICRDSKVPPNLFILNTSYLIIKLHPLWSHFFSFLLIHNWIHVTTFTVIIMVCCYTFLKNLLLVFLF